MKIIALNCNHCGAPLEVSAKARFVTCGFCEAKLKVEHTGNSYSTAVLEELKETTQQIARDVAKLKSSTELRDLDEQWKRDRVNYIVTGKNGRQSLPTKAGAAVGGIAIACFGLFWTIMAAGITSQGARMGAPGVIRIFPLFGLIFVFAGLYGAYNAYTRAKSYEQANKRYMDERRQFLDKATRDD